MITDVRIEKIDEKNILIKYYFDPIPTARRHRIMQGVESSQLYKYLSEVYNVAYAACENSTIAPITERDVEGEKEIMKEVGRYYDALAREDFKRHYAPMSEDCPFTNEELNNMTLEQINDFLENELNNDIAAFAKNTRRLD